MQRKNCNIFCSWLFLNHVSNYANTHTHTFKRIRLCLSSALATFSLIKNTWLMFVIMKKNIFTLLHKGNTMFIFLVLEYSIHLLISFTALLLSFVCHYCCCCSNWYLTAWKRMSSEIMTFENDLWYKRMWKRHWSSSFFPFKNLFIVDDVTNDEFVTFDTESFIN